VAAAIVLGAVLGFAGVALSNTLAWVGAAALLIPAYIKEHRKLAKQPIDPEFVTLTTPIAIVGPVDGSMNVDAVVTTQPIKVVPPARGAKAQDATKRR